MTDYLPFRPGLVPLEGANDIYQYPTNAAVVVRREGNMYDENAEMHTRALIPLLNELPEFGINVARFSPVVTHEHDHALVVEKVQGDSFKQDHYSGMSDRQNAEARQLLDAQYEYIAKKVETDEAFLTDIIGANQYIFTPTNGPILIDLGAGICPPSHDTDYTYRIGSEVTLLESILIEAGQLVANDTELQDWRSKGILLMQKIADINGFNIDEATKQRLVDLSLGIEELSDEYSEEGIDEELDQTLKKLLQSPNNSAYQQRNAEQRKKLEATH